MHVEARDGPTLTWLQAAQGKVQGTETEGSQSLSSRGQSPAQLLAVIDSSAFLEPISKAQEWVA
jgi:hypothetical protein